MLSGIKFKLVTKSATKTESWHLFIFAAQKYVVSKTYHKLLKNKEADNEETNNSDVWIANWGISEIPEQFRVQIIKYVLQ